METTSTGDLGGAQRGARGKDIGNLYRFEEPLLADLKTKLDGAVEGLLEAAKAEIHTVIAKATELRQVGLAEVAQQRAALEDEMKAMTKFALADDVVVELNVGGTKYTTSVATLRSKPGSMLDVMFSGRYAFKKDQDGRIFLDREGDVFSYILSYLRDGFVPVGPETDEILLRRLKREFEYFNLPLEVNKSFAFVAGGVDENDEVIYSVERFDFNQNYWQPLAPMPSARQCFGLCAVGNALFAIGGINASAETLTLVETYDLDEARWGPCASMGTARGGPGVCVVDDRIYALGGFSPQGGVLASMERYNPSENTWEAVEPIPMMRSYCGLCVLDNCIYVVGGVDSASIPSGVCQKYDTKADVWSSVAPLSQCRQNPGLCAFDNHIYAVGGYCDQLLAIVERYDPSTDTWTTCTPMPYGTDACTAFASDGRLYAVGGENRFSVGLDSVAVYDPKTNTWSTGTPMIMGRSKHGGCMLSETTNFFDNLLAMASASVGEPSSKRRRQQGRQPP